MDDSFDLGDSIVAIYEFDYDDVTRSTEDLPTEDVPTPVASDAVETLAMLGREDDECDVTLKGFA